ncbi:MAG: SAM-dependent methyltransferase [Clostridiales bacterium]|nr:SAM-dependent methyltransferase [Clostridiales bacterium]
MKYTLSKVVPWGRNYNEYVKMFMLSDEECNLKIASFGDGPASFNCDSNGNVISFDPIYNYSKEEIEKRILETKDEVIKQTELNRKNFIWNEIKNTGELETLRMDAMKKFLEDFEKGKKEGRYIPFELPKKLPFNDKYFDIGLSSHFLLLYSELGLKFHFDAIDEILKVCKEVRIFPILDLDANKSALLEPIINRYKEKYEVSIRDTTYEFQKEGNKLLVIKE